MSDNIHFVLEHDVWISEAVCMSALSNIYALLKTHVCFQQIVHGALCHIFGLVELLQSLSDLLILDFTLTLLLVIIVQASALQLLQMMLKGTISGRYDWLL